MTASLWLCTGPKINQVLAFDPLHGVAAVVLKDRQFHLPQHQGLPMLEMLAVVTVSCIRGIQDGRELSIQQIVTVLDSSALVRPNLHATEEALAALNELSRRPPVDQFAAGKAAQAELESFLKAASAPLTPTPAVPVEMIYRSPVPGAPPQIVYESINHLDAIDPHTGAPLGLPPDYLDDPRR